jgi:hypothetical protein
VKQQLNASLSVSEYEQGERPTAVGEDAPRVDRVPIALLFASRGAYFIDSVDPTEGPVSSPNFPEVKS